MFGKGLLKGLNVTWKEFWAKKFTVQYPEKQHPKPPRFHGRFQLDPDNCIACNLCANACPNGVIKLNSAKVGKKKYLTSYVMNIQYCLFCGFCVDACPRGALNFTIIHDMTQFYYEDVPLVLVDREPPPPEESESGEEKGGSDEGQEKGDKKKKAKSSGSDKSKDESDAGQASEKEGQ